MSSLLRVSATPDDRVGNLTGIWTRVKSSPCCNFTQLLMGLFAAGALFCLTLSVAWLAEHAHELTATVHPVPRPIDQEVARLKLAALGMTIDTLTEEQVAYLGSREEGT